MPIKILVVTPDFYPNVSGYGNACHGFVKAIIDNSDASIDVLTFAELKNAPEMRGDNLNIYRLSPLVLWRKDIFFWNDLKIWRRIKILESKYKYDFIFFETVEFPLSILLSLRAFKSKTIIRVHAASETEWSLFNKKLVYRIKKHPTKLVFKNINNILVTTSFYIDFIKFHFLKNNPLLISSKYFDVIPNILPPRLQEQVVKPEFEQLLRDNLVFMTLGRMDVQGEIQKNFSRLLIAISYLRNKTYFQNFKLILIGKGDFKVNLEKLVQLLNIDGNVLFYESMDNEDVHYLQAHSNGVILASTFEGMSMFALEALSNGAPLIFSNTGGLRDLVVPSYNGVLFNPLDPKDIAEKIDFYISTLSENILQLRKNSLDWYANKFSSNEIIKSFLTYTSTIKTLNEINKNTNR